jgi:NitT/TauT family transport system ATP-binding protein
MDLIADHISHRFGTLDVLDDVSFTVRAGEVVAVVGPSGCGKSTLLSILGGLLQPSGGAAELRGAPPADSLNPLTFVFQDFALLPWCTVEENVQFPLEHTGLSPSERRAVIDDALRRTGLTDFRSAHPKQLSGGMRQRVGIAQALLNDPQLLIVDEPTAGLDPEERVRFRNLLSELSGERIVILSTHIVSDVEAVATDIAILNHGLLLAHDSPESLLAAISGKVWEIIVPSAGLPAVQQQHLISSTAHRSDGVHVRVVCSSPPMPQAQPLEPTLEDAYLASIAGSRIAPAGVAS